jgi:hypothetical protein
MHDRKGNLIEKPGKDDMPRAFIVEPGKLVGKTKDRWDRLLDRMKERDCMAIRPMDQIGVVDKTEPGPVPAPPQPAPKGPPDWIPNLDELKHIREAMARHAHNKWMEARAKEKGWHNPKDCPVKDIATELVKATGLKADLPEGCFCVKCHPCMVPYEDLVKTEQDIDRAYPIAFLTILKDMGYIVVKADKLP